MEQKRQVSPLPMPAETKRSDQGTSYRESQNEDIHGTIEDVQIARHQEPNAIASTSSAHDTRPDYLSLEEQIPRENDGDPVPEHPDYLSMEGGTRASPEKPTSSDNNKPGYTNIQQLQQTAKKKDYVNVDSWTQPKDSVEMQENETPKYVNYKDSSLQKPVPEINGLEQVEHDHEQDTYYNEPSLHYYNSKTHLPSSTLNLNQT